MTRTIHVIEINPHHPRPFVMTEVAVCLRDAIRKSGFASEHFVNEIPNRDFCIVIGATPQIAGELPGLDPGHCAILNLEQLGSPSILVTPEYLDWLRDWLVVDYHSSNVDWLKRRNGPSQQALELPVLPSLQRLNHPTPPSPSSDKTDVVFFGTPNERRQRILNQLSERGLSCNIVAGAYGKELTPALELARLVLHIHYYDTRLFPVARLLQPVARGIPVVCEESAFSNHANWADSGVLFAKYDDLAQACSDLLSKPLEMKQRAAATQAYVQHLPFQTDLEAVYQALLNASIHAARPANQAATDASALSDLEIEALLAVEATHIPEAGTPVPPTHLAETTPGNGVSGKWLLWVMAAFILIGLLQSWR